MGISPDQFQNKNNGKKDKPKTEIMGFGDVAGNSKTPSTEKEGVKKETPVKEKKQTPAKEKQESTSSTKKEKTVQKKDEPTNEEPKVEVELKEEEKTGNDPVQEAPKEPVVEDGKQGEKQDGDSTPTVEDKQDDEPPTPGKNDEGEEEMTNVKQEDSLMDLFKTDEPERELRGYMLDKDLIKKLEKIGKKIPRKKGGTSAFVNKILKEALKEKGLWDKY